jgi:cell volume regulation protein A
MAATIIIAVCVLLLLAYLFDITAPRTRVPAVVLLLLLGWIVKRTCAYFNVHVPSLDPLLPILGTIGLILIVLEGALELELNSSKKKVIIRSVFSALLPIFMLSLGLAWIFQYYLGYSFRASLLSIIPLCVISSSIAISAGRNLSAQGREFVVYESSLSDIFGVLFFNFVNLNESLTLPAVTDFSIQLALIIVVSFFATLLLSYMLNKIDHHIKFAPIILLVILIYEVSKVYHLPALLFILLFGLFMGNLEEIKDVKWIQQLRPDKLAKEVHKFREITTEATFLIRSLFFLLFGFLMKSSELLNLDTLKWSSLIVVAIFLTRAITLKITATPLMPYVFFAPRGLITILLFFAIPSEMQIDIVNNSLVLQVIVMSSLLMMLGMMLTKRPVIESRIRTIPEDRL